MKTYQDLINKSLKLVRLNEKEEKAIYILLEYIFNVPLSNILANANIAVSETKLKEFSDLFYEYLIEDKPIEYIVGYTYFYDLKLKVNKNVLIPRKESEELVEKAIDILRGLDIKTIADIGVGSGNIALSLKNNLPNVEKVYGVDISKKALEICKENMKNNNIDIELINDNLLDYFIKSNIKLDVIISNPPYIDIEDKNISKSVRKYEPKEALFSKQKGLFHIEKILKEAKKVLNKNGFIFLEIGFNQKKDVEQLILKYFKEAKFEILKDIGRNDRVVVINNI